MTTGRQRVREQLLASARERLLICVCGVSERDARTLGGALKRIATIKLQMSPGHEIAIASVARGPPHLRVAREFTRDVGALERSIDDAAGLGSEVDVLSMDALLRDAANYFGRHADADETEGGCYRLLLVLQQNDTAPAVDTNRIGLAESFFSNERASLDVVYWHQHMPTTKAQATFDQICSFDSDNPLSNFYFLEVGDSLERLHQVLVLMLSNPTHRVDQHTAEQLLGSVFSPSQPVESGAR